MSHRALLVAFHYPPAAGSSGNQRTLSFSRYLSDYGWDPLVLSASPTAYPVVSEGQLRDVPEEVVVVRALALDTARHLALGGRYFAPMAYPDRWVSWWAGAVYAGWRMIRKYSPKVIWSTYPIATAHLIALTLHRISGLPWVADFRDSMTEDHYPADPRKRSVYKWVERRTVDRAARCIFTSPGAVEMYKSRYPDQPQEKWSCLFNGFDENAFLDLPASTRTESEPEKVTLLHSGILYPSERDPTEFFAALRELSNEGVIDAARLRIVLRATGYDDLLQSMIEESGVQEIVHLRPAMDYRSALSEMSSVDGLLIFQASNCNHQIPAKLFEYIRAQRPILALTDPEGDTAGLLRSCGLDTIVRLNSRAEIKAGLAGFLSDIAHKRAKVAPPQVVQSYSRRTQTQDLVHIFEDLVRDRMPNPA